MIGIKAVRYVKKLLKKKGITNIINASHAKKR